MKPRRVVFWGIPFLILFLLLLNGCAAPGGSVGGEAAPAAADAAAGSAPAAEMSAPAAAMEAIWTAAEAAPPVKPAASKDEPSAEPAAVPLAAALAATVSSAEGAQWGGAEMITGEVLLYGQSDRLALLAAAFALTPAGEPVNLDFFSNGWVMQRYQSAGDLPADQLAEQINEMARSSGFDAWAEPNLLITVSGHGGGVFGSPSQSPLPGPNDGFEQQWIWFDQGIRLPGERSQLGKGVTVGVFDTCPTQQPAWVDQMTWITTSVGANNVYLEHGASAAALVDYVAPDARIELYCVLDSDGYGTLADLIAGLAKFISQQQAAADRVVINLSLGIHGSSPQLDAMLAQAHTLGFVVVAAAGNQGNVNAMNIPALYHTVIGVAGHTVDRQPSNFTNLGEMAAPAGGNSSAAELAKAVCADQPERFVITPADSSPTGHLCWQGTSFAAPLVSGAAALILEKDPALTPDDVANKLYGTAEAGAPLFGAGMMDVTQALQ